MSAPPLAVIVGPTAAGKSALAMATAEAVGGEIVSADSVQIYRGLDIGSAKPTPAEQARVRHHVLDALDPTEQSHAGRWLALAELALADIRSRGRVPIVCGGTGLYVKVLLHGLAPVPEVTPEVRAAVALDLASRGPERLHAELARLDPEAAARLAPRDSQRIARALAVARQTGQPLSAFQGTHGFAERRHEARVVALWPERDALMARIDARAAAMVRDGLVPETRALLAAGVPPDAPAMSSLGYRQLLPLLAGTGTLADAVRQTAHDTHRYLRHQETWLRRNPRLRRFDVTEPGWRERVLAETGAFLG